MLAFTNAYFSESRLFKGLQPIQIRKIRSRLRIYAKCLSRVPLLFPVQRLSLSPHCRRPSRPPGSRSGEQKICSTWFRFLQAFVQQRKSTADFRPPQSIAVDQEQAELSGLAGHPRATDPRAPCFHIESKPAILSFPRKRESRGSSGAYWMPAFAGMTDGGVG